MDCGVIVIGAGLAGVISALAAAKEKQDVLLVDRGSMCLGTNSALSGGVFTAPTSSYGIDEYIEDTIKIGRMINHRKRVELIGREAQRAFEFLSSISVHLTEMKDCFAYRPDGLSSIPGTLLMKSLLKILEKTHEIKKITGLYVTEIMENGNRVSGIRGFNREGKEIELHAPSVILATGGGGAIYRFNDNQRKTMGQGYHIAAKVGLSLWDMEFVQFYPLVITEPHLPMTLIFPPFDRHIRLVDGEKRDILEAYNMKSIDEAILKKRDEFSSLLMKEMEKGPVFMDLSLVEPSRWKMFPLNLLKKIIPNLPSRPIRISPAAHFFMGGVKTDERLETSIKGLFACGEVTWGFHGANRRGGNALTECVTGGMIAGESAARNAEKSGYKTCSISIRDAVKGSGSKGRIEELKNLRNLVRAKAWDACGIFRCDKDIKKGMTEVENIEDMLISISPTTVYERALKEDLISAVFTLKAVLEASSGRQESRGCFKREEFPLEDNENWLKNSCLVYNREKRRFSLEFHDLQS